MFILSGQPPTEKTSSVAAEQTKLAVDAKMGDDEDFEIVEPPAKRVKPTGDDSDDDIVEVL